MTRNFRDRALRAADRLLDRALILLERKPFSPKVAIVASRFRREAYPGVYEDIMRDGQMAKDGKLLLEKGNTEELARVMKSPLVEYKGNGDFEITNLATRIVEVARREVKDTYLAELPNDITFAIFNGGVFDDSYARTKARARYEQCEEAIISCLDVTRGRKAGEILNGFLRDDALDRIIDNLPLNTSFSY